MAPFRVEDFLERLWEARPRYPRHKSVRITEQEIRTLCREAQTSFLAQSSLLEIQGPIKICGDIHGQFFDLLRLFHLFKGGRPPKTRYLFLGDYVDRGKNSLETICLLLSLKVAYPNSFYMVRGNHESKPINRTYGFHSEIRRRFKTKDFQVIFEILNRTFDHIPLAAVVNGNIFCCHGGLSPNLHYLDQIRQLNRPMIVPRDNWVTDVLWSDPDENIDGYEKQDHPDTNPRHRGIGHLFGQDALEEFLEDNDLIMICRAHECVPNGYRWSFDKQLVTIFSAPNYSEGNAGAMMSVSGTGRVGFHLFS